ncbi:hypothetical protein EHI8A_145770 [Entamoeba histolytica HM-1:IMSS-B]|uniref:Uncharacterized protein n=5 Tax=Entamoeba histolytica TaxID=5759 RepID=B1N4P4_ENTH1|nr:hypothetical protein EHI_173600 [Entamoeba histolytica HM-1:IMSS]EMD43096.1 Hypothetical protein EHI5A_178170 [Entamoeba histolytica KU27]EMH77619.1 hypothetical protein EHI8A_145770 [Entamoeba histolytica HM-1:IMSS-B]ENY62248.1 hypothetical protein EHI7A_129100 [Entamoeba histolytica HM-1:IMSS-A]GAT98683.1 hypothetical protein CL6EHI_173600 [Entamoeba histolytica]EDS89063.1 hypothetical protein EHI_173600 [Entamoeba histolytica HM-1:IMSS]|eukprot:XP_001914160.1 hypothetical protein EHI_173600 [Entamoeba histolytica HM-1:IMSS]
MSNMNRPKDDIYADVASMDVMDVYTESRADPNVNSFLKKFFYTMREPSYIDWKLNNSDKIKNDDERQDLLRQKLESIRRCERMSEYLDEINIGLASFNSWNRKFAKKLNQKTINQSTIPEWVRRCSSREKEIAVVEERERGALLSVSEKGDKEKKPKKVDKED